MSYLTITDMETAFGEDEVRDLADRDRDGIPDEPVIDDVIARTTAIVDGYLASRFALPLAEVPQMVRDCALSVARYRLAGDHATDRIRDDYKQALSWLGQIRDGKLDVGLTASSVAAAERAGGGPQHHDGRETFPRDRLDAFLGGGS